MDHGYNKQTVYVLKNELGQTLFVGKLKTIRRRFKYVFGDMPSMQVPRAAAQLGYSIHPASPAELPETSTATYTNAMADLKEKLKNVPHQPGVYLFKDKAGRVLYVGKAKDLRNRVLQYFGHDSRPQLPYLMEEAADFDVTVVHTELESLFLENTLIKQYLPPYNIKLRDDKNYAFIKIDNTTQIPQITYTRQLDDKPQTPSGEKLESNKYFGPYSSTRKIKQTLDLVRKIFPYCASKEVGKRPCFYYFLHRCPGVCIGTVTLEEYRQQLDRIMLFLSGHTSEIVKRLKQEMKRASAKRTFELAARLRDQLQALSVLEERQIAMFPKRVNWDFVSLFNEYGNTCVNIFKIREGRLIDKENFIYNDPKLRLHPNAEIQNTAALVLEKFLENYYAEVSDIPKEIFIQEQVTNAALLQNLLKLRSGRAVHITTPTRGQKLKLIQLGITNAREYMRKWQSTDATNADALMETLKQLQALLKLPTLPRRIECYDISNIQGTNPVGSMVVFKDGLPAKSEYRKFKINIKNTPDDFAMMREMLSRRLERLENNKVRIKSKDAMWPAPDLMVIDGGKPQLGVAVDVLRSAELQIPVAGLAKRIEEIFVPGKKAPIVLGHDNPILQLLQRLRDEAHRFAITFHRQLRSKSATKSALDSIPGIGPKTKKLLKAKFGTVSSIRAANLEDLVKLIGKGKAEQVKKYL